MLDLHRLRLLSELSRRKTIAATAKALGYSASAVSQQLATLEREAGISLLDRAAHSVEFTYAGRQLVTQADQILALVESAEAELHTDAGNPAGRVTVGAIPTAAVVFAPVLAHNLRQYPGLTLQLRQMRRDEGVQQVRSGELDIALVDDWGGFVSKQKKAGLHFRHLLHDALVLVFPHGHPIGDSAAPIDLKNLRNEPWIAAPAEEPSRVAVDRLLARVGGGPPVPAEFEGLGTILSLVSGGIGIAAVPELALASGHYPVTARGIPGKVPVRELYAITRTNSLRRASISVTLDAIEKASRARAAKTLSYFFDEVQ